MTHDLPAMNAAQRDALRKAITGRRDWREHAARRGWLRPDGQPIDASMLRAEHMGPLAADLGIDVQAIAAGQPPAATETATETETETATETETETADPIAAAVSAVLDGPFAGLADRVADLATARAAAEQRAAHAEQRAADAARRAAMPRAAGTDTATPVHVATVAEQPAGVVFGSRSRALTGATVRVYDDPRAPAIDPDYVWPADLAADLVTAIGAGMHVWLHGPAGTGKSSAAAQLAARLGRPYTRIGFSLDSSYDTVIGATGLRDGRTYFEPGALTRALRTPGAVILLDEITGARAATLLALHQILDGGILTLPDGSELRPAEDVIILAADNTNGTGDATGNYHGTSVMNGALRSRFGLFLEVGYLPADQESGMVHARTGYPLRACETIVTVAGMSREQAIQGLLTEGMGPREVLALARMLHAGRPLARALSGAVYGRRRSDDAEILRQLCNAHLTQQAIDQAINPPAAPAAPAAPAEPNPSAPEFGVVTSVVTN